MILPRPSMRPEAALWYGSSHSGFDLQLSPVWVFAWRSRLAIVRV
jgi:hypothetical protein